MATIDTIADRSTGSAIAGKAYFETSTNKFIVYNGSAWIEIDSDGTGAVFENRWGASFDGSNDYLDCGNDSSLAPASMTVSAWFKASGTVGTFNYIMSKSGAVYGSIHLRYTSANKFNIFLGLSGGHRDLTFNTAQTLTDWHHVAVTYDGADVKGYVDGVNDLSVAATGAINYTANSAGDHLWIGKGPYPDKAEGLIDDAAIFSTALSAADITKIYNSGVPTNLTDAASYDTDRTSNLKGYWRMGDDSNDTATSGGSIATITDSSGNGNDAVQATASNQPTFKALAQSTTSLSFDTSDKILFDGTTNTGSNILFQRRFGYTNEQLVTD